MCEVIPMRNLREWHGADTREEALLHRCRDAIRSVIPTATVILYGSRARGNARPESDYDLLVLVDEPPSIQLEERIWVTDSRPFGYGWAKRGRSLSGSRRWPAVRTAEEVHAAGGVER